MGKMIKTMDDLITYHIQRIVLNATDRDKPSKVSDNVREAPILDVSKVAQLESLRDNLPRLIGGTLVICNKVSGTPLQDCKVTGIFGNKKYIVVNVIANTTGEAMSLDIPSPEVVLEFQQRDVYNYKGESSKYDSSL